MREGWVYKKLDDCCEIEYGTRVVQKKDGGTIYPVYGGGGETFRMDRYNREDCLVVARFAMSKTCVRYVSGKFFLNDSGLSVNVGEELLQSYLNHHIMYLNDDIYNLGKGAAQRNLDVNAFRKLTIAIPSLSIQQSIVSELDEINNLLSLKRKELETYDKLAQSLFYEMFGDPVENEKGWEAKKLGEISKFRRGSFPQPYGEPEWYDGEGAMPFVQVADLQDDAFELVKITKKQISMKAQPMSIFVPTGTVLVSLQGSIGKVAISQYDCYVDRTVAIFNEIDTSYCTKTFFAFVLKHIFAEKKKIARGISIKTITKEEFTAFNCFLPPLPLQQLFAQRVEAIEQQKTQVKVAIEKLETLLAARMQYYFD